jgi:micrococcal nuclease
MRRATAALLAIGAAASISACGGDATGAVPRSSDAGPDPRSVAVLEHVVDGDTIDVIMSDGREERIRLTGIDTPEIAHAATGDRPGNPAECFADEAHEFVRQLLPVGTEVRLERDVVGRDDYGRLLAYVYRADDDVFVNHEIVRRGYAQPLTIPPNVAFADRFVAAARDAEADDLGLWSVCSGA